MLWRLVNRKNIIFFSFKGKFEDYLGLAIAAPPLYELRSWIKKVNMEELLKQIIFLKKWTCQSL